MKTEIHDLSTRVECSQSEVFIARETRDEE